ncbi:MAG: hypothetical protein HC840_00200 [Leptolyngbyaceae cyanobacterium RM2_2_4]|nr:hypothetical protein [Leptolyngbyaceae cyanobacterium RM2_2_4]
MRLSARPLLNYVNVNNFSYGNQWIIRAGDPNTLYFQVFDLDQGPASVVGAPNPVFGFQGSASLAGNIGLRYMVGVGSGNTPAGITVTVPSIDDTQVINLQAVQDPNDKSIWSVTLGPNHKPGSGNVQFAVAEGNSIRRFSALNVLGVEDPTNDGSC